MIIIIYGLLVLAGGIIGFVKSHSEASLVAGVLAGTALIYSGVRIRKGNVLKANPLEWSIAFFTTGVLAIFFCYRFALSYAFMPAGLMGILSITTLTFLTIRLIASKRQPAHK